MAEQEYLPDASEGVSAERGGGPQADQSAAADPFDSAQDGLSPDELRQALEEERSRAERYLANWQRAQADFVNYRRRAEQERSEQAKYAGAFVIVQLLPVIDDLERALNSVSAALAGLSWVDGIGLIYRKLQMVIEAQGLVEISAQGERFDPSIHEAVHYADGEEGRVISVVQKGYRLHERAIRPALVVVGRGGPAATGESAAPSS